MKPGAIDRLLAVGLIGALVLWGACLAVLWADVTAVGVLSLLPVLAGVSAAAAVSAPLPWRLALALQAILIRLRVLDVRAIELVTSGPTAPRDVRRAARLLGGGAALAALCAGASTLLLWPGREAAVWLAGNTTLTAGGEAVLAGALAGAGLLPFALGVCVVLLLTAAVRSGGGRDAFAGPWRDWLFGAAAGLAAFSVLIGAGATLLGLCGAAGGATLVAALGWLVRRDLGSAPRRAVPAVRRQAAGPTLSVVVVWAVVGLAAAVQCRMLTDLAALPLPLRAAWLAAGLGLVAGFAGALDRRSRPPSRAAGGVAAIGAISALFGQAALVVTAARMGSERMGGAAALAALALLTQVPLCACVAGVLVRGRAGFARSGGRAHVYLAAAGVGLAAGLVAAVCVGWSGRAVLLLPFGAALLTTGAALRGILGARTRGEPARWAACTMLALVGFAALGWGAVGGRMMPLRRIRPGVGLTLQVGPPRVLLPRPAGEPSEQIAKTADAVASAGRGQWCVVATLPADVPPGLGASAQEVRAYDPGLPELPRAEGLGLPAGPARFDGLLLAPPPARHPDFHHWCNVGRLRTAVGRVHRGAPLLLRVRAPEGALPALAWTFREAVGSGRMLAAEAGGQVDVLLIGPRAAAAGTPAAYGTDLDEICDNWPDARPVRAGAPATWRLRSDGR